jgi:hypothetical protein
MKRTRRVTLEISHRSLSITRIESHSVARPDIPPFAPSDCAQCGAPWVLVVRDAESGFDDGSQLILNALLQRGMHAYFSAAGQLWVCSRSFQNLSENL